MALCSSSCVWLLLLASFTARAAARTLPATGQIPAEQGVVSVPSSIAELAAPYPLQEHSVWTEDGYGLTLFRIPHGLTGAGQLQRHGNDVEDDPRPPVLLQHGLLDSCAGFLLAGPQALAFQLADAGFDVWLANSRGSTQSRRHAWLPVSSADFWSFSFDEMAKYDLPATLAYVRRATGAPRVSYVAHSQGGTILLAALASQPRLGEQLRTAVLMAPVAGARHMQSAPMLALATLNTDSVFALLGVHEFLPSNKAVGWMEGQLCGAQPDLCVSILTAISGYRRGAVNNTRLPIYLAFTPAGTSVQNIEHWAQQVRGRVLPSQLLTWYDWGSDCGIALWPRPCNQKAYGPGGPADPPSYSLSSVNASLVLILGGQDRLADSLDSELLLEALPASSLARVSRLPDYEHLDFIWGLDAPQRVYAGILQDLLQDAQEHRKDMQQQRQRLRATRVRRPPDEEAADQ